MTIPFDPIRTVQAAGVLLRTTPSRCMSRLRLLKLLYVAERESLQETGLAITGDSVWAMDNGPDLTRTYDMIKDEDPNRNPWARYFRNADANLVELLEDPGEEQLSRYSLRKLHEVAERFAEQDDWSLADYTHGFAEWKKNRPQAGSSRAIPDYDILRAIGYSPSAARSMLEESRTLAEESRILTKPPCP